MNSIFEQDSYSNIVSRVNALTPSTTRQWGTMTPAQMMAHVSGGLDFALGTTPTKKSFVGKLLGWMVKSNAFNDKPFGQGAPTVPSIKMKEEKNFDSEKKHLLALLEKLHTGGSANATKYPHPFFGDLTGEQWGMHVYKHVDHHLRQFGV